MSDSVRPHRRKPTRPLRPWDSPGKNTGVGCHFLLQCVNVKSESEVTQLCLTLSDPMDCSLPGFSVHGIFQARVLEWGAIAFSIFPSSTTLFTWFYSNTACVIVAKRLLLGVSSFPYPLPTPPHINPSLTHTDRQQLESTNI